MPVNVKRSGGFLFKRSIQKLVEGAELEWRGDETIAVVNDIISEVAASGSKLVRAKVREIIAARAYETGALYRSVKVIRSHYRRGVELGRPVTEYLVMAGDEGEIGEYAFHVETGRYNKETGTRVPAVPYMRQGFSQTKAMIRQMFMTKLRQRLEK